MIVDILHHTPAWVFVLFVALVALGLSRTRASEMPVSRLFLLPVAMTGFSLFGLVQAIGAGSALVAWIAAYGAVLAIAATVPLRGGPQDRVQYSSATGRVRVPGSWLPLILMMSIFFLRYAVAVVLAIHLALRTDPAFAASVAGLYGLTSAGFAARALRTWRAAVGTTSSPATLRPAA